jgi:hypothetical protein
VLQNWFGVVAIFYLVRLRQEAPLNDSLASLKL